MAKVLEFQLQHQSLIKWSRLVSSGKRHINSLRYADDTTVKAESEEELKSLLIRVKESEKSSLKLNTQITKIMASSPITSW